MLTRIRQVAKTDKFWIVLSTVASRGSAFLVGMLITRLQGTAALGLYSATLNVAASLTSPFTSVLQNNAALMAARHPLGAGRGLLWRLHLPVFLVLMALGLAGFALLAPHSGFHDLWHGGSGLIWLAAGCVLFYQLQNAIVQGLLQGVGGFVRPAKWLLVLTVFISLVAIPMIAWAGLHGAYGVLVLNSVLPPLLLLTLFLLPGRVEPASRRAEVASPNLQALAHAHMGSWPTVLAALFGSAVSWFCLVYLANQSHGADGLGWVSLGVQWGTLMLLPVTSWGGVTLKRLVDACDASAQVMPVLQAQIAQNALVTLAVVLGVVLVSPWLAALYKIDWAVLWPLLAVSGLYALLAAINNVFERLFFCINRQLWWLWMSIGAALVQCVVTFCLIPQSFLGVAWGLSAGSAVLL